MCILIAAFTFPLEVPYSVPFFFRLMVLQISIIFIFYLYIFFYFISLITIFINLEKP